VLAEHPQGWRECLRDAVLTRYRLELTDLLEVVELSRDYNPELDVRVLLTRVDPRTKDTAEMMEFLAEQKLTVLPTKVCERVAFRRAIGEGVIVQELGKDQAAIAEIEAFFREVQA